MNDYDTSRMLELLAKQGYESIAAAADADLVILNSCAIREKSEQKVKSAAGKLKELKRSNPGLVVAVAGCVPQQEGEHLLHQIQVADFIFGPDQIPNLPLLLDRQRRGFRFAAVDVIEVEDYSFLDADPVPSAVKIAELVTIQKGCDNHCAYCIVPATRGREVSRPPDEVVAEATRMIERGAREITLIGQNVNSYHAIGTPDGDDFAELLTRVGRIPGLLRLRYTTSHPKDFTRKVADAFVDVPTLMPCLHLPVQSGSSKTLRRMVRGYTRDEYVAQVDYLRGLLPNISLTTDVIVGYPGETEEDFAETLTLLDEMQYDNVYSFVYSERPDTPALKLKLKDDVPAPVKEERLWALQAMQKKIIERRLERHIGTTQAVLIEGESRQSSSTQPQLCGRIPTNETVNIDLPVHLAIRPGDVRGQIVHAPVFGRTKYTLQAHWPSELTTVANARPSAHYLPVVS